MNFLYPKGYLVCIYFISFVFIISCFGAGCSSFSEKKLPEEKGVALSVFQVDTGSVVINTNFLGTVEGKFNVDIRPQVSGELQEAYVDEGDHVRKGQSLFKVDQQKYQEDLNRALARENVEKANLINAQTEVERLRPLVENEVMAPVRLEKEKSNYKVAEANLKQAEAEVANARIRLGYTIIKAPVSGYIGRIEKRVGNLVNAGDKDPITTLTDVQEVYVYFSINESDFFNILKGRAGNSDSAVAENSRKVTLILADGSTYPQEGIIDASSGQVNKSTGTVTMRATFQNHDNILRSGNTGTLVMYRRENGKILIPQKATFELQAETFVQKLTPDNRVVRQLVKIDAAVPSGQFIIASGLKAGDRILTEGLGNVTDSMKVIPLPYHPDSLMTTDVHFD